MIFLEHNTENSVLQEQIVTNRIIISLLAIVIVMLILVLPRIFKSKKFSLHKLFSVLEHHIGVCAVSVFGAGVVLYCIGFWSGGSAGNLFTVFFRSVLSSLEMFVSHSDLIEVRHELHDNNLYMCIFAITHFFAVFLSAICIIPTMVYTANVKFVIRNLKAKTLYIFWGQNENSFLLAKDIIKREKASHKIVFVSLPSDEHGEGELHFRHLFNGSLVKNEKMDFVRENRALLFNSCETILSKREKNISLQEVLSAAKLKKLYKAIMRPSVSNVKIFILSDNYLNNIKSLGTLIAVTETDCSAPILKKNIDVYCHTSNNDLCSIYDNKSNHKIAVGKNNIHVHIVDSDYLSVVYMKKSGYFSPKKSCDLGKYHPIRCLDVDSETGLVKSPFTALIVGMQATAIEAFKFVYEFSAFATADGSKNPTKIYIASDDVDEKRSTFYYNFPALRNNPEVELCQISRQSPNFWDWVETFIERLNYVVIATPIAIDNISIASELYRFACRKRNDKLKNLKIFVHSNDSKYFRELHDTSMYYKHSNKEYGGDIIPFGQKKNIFTYSNIVSERHYNTAKHYYNKYASSTEEKPKSWEERSVKLSESYENQKELFYKQSQDIANTWHIATKLVLAGICTDKDMSKASELVKCITSRPDMKAYYQELYDAKTKEERLQIIDKYCTYNNATDEQQQLLRNIARTEHLRWSALMELLGFEASNPNIKDGDKNEKNYISQKHSCLVSNEILESVTFLRETIPYDYNVVDTSFSLAMEDYLKTIGN